MLPTKRFLGLELGGAKNNRTTLAVLDYFPKAQKIFLSGIFDRIGPKDGASGDEELLHMLKAHLHVHSSLAINAPLSLPPCFGCSLKSCQLKKTCQNSVVKWTKNFLKKTNNITFTPYTQRPFEIWLKKEILPLIRPDIRFEIDETLGGSKAPVTARAMYLKKMILPAHSIEVFSKLTIVRLAHRFKIEPRLIRNYRKLESGKEYREKILEILADSLPVFIYEHDFSKLSKHLASFDAFFAAYSAFLFDQGQCHEPPRSFPVQSGWAYFPPM